VSFLLFEYDEERLFVASVHHEFFLACDKQLGTLSQGFVDLLDCLEETNMPQQDVKLYTVVKCVIAFASSTQGEKLEPRNQQPHLVHFLSNLAVSTRAVLGLSPLSRQATLTMCKTLSVP
jgi:hypothetical protein